MTTMGYLGVRGKLIHENNLKTKISFQTPFKSLLPLLLSGFYFFLKITFLFLTFRCPIPTGE